MSRLYEDITQTALPPSRGEAMVTSPGTAGFPSTTVNAFCRIRGYVSTARKNQVPVIQALTNAFEGRPFILVPLES